MSLSAREQQILKSIRAGLAGSDPGLASLLTTFTRLTCDEDMPATEKIRPGRRRLALPWPRRPARPLAAARRPLGWRPRPLGWQRLGWQRSMLLLWLVVTVTLTGVALAVGRGGGGRLCRHSNALVCAAQLLRATDRAAPGAGSASGALSFI